MRTHSLALLASGLVVAFAGSGIALANPPNPVTPANLQENLKA